MAVITIPKPLRDKLGDEATEGLTDVIKEIDISARQDAIAIAEERLERRLTEDIGKVNERLTEEIGKISERITRAEERFERRLAEEIGKVNERLSEEIGKFNERLSEEMGKVHNRISRFNTDIIKCMFIFWATQLGLIFTFLKFMIK